MYSSLSSSHFVINANKGTIGDECPFVFVLRVCSHKSNQLIKRGFVLRPIGCNQFNQWLLKAVSFIPFNSLISSCVEKQLNWRR